MLSLHVRQIRNRGILMHTKTRASAVKIYLFFLFISLFAVSGCGLDVDFGGSGNDGNANVKSNETIMGTIETVPPEYEESSFVVRACNEEERCEEVDDVSEGKEFSLEGDFDPKIELEILESGNEIASRTIEIFPGATIEIEDMAINDNEEINYDPEDVDITFNGEVSNENYNCIEGNGELNGRIEVTISSDGSETDIKVRLDDTEILGEDDPMCSQIDPGSKVEVDGKLTGEPRTVEATIIEIE